jgi:hypothetical protein
MDKSQRDAARAGLVEQVFAARTLAEIAAAKRALRDWLAAHPDEPGMADAFEVLSHQEDFARGEVETPSNPAKRKGGRGTARERLLEQVFSARTLAEIGQAKQALRSWLAKHPDEAEMADTLQVLAYQEAIARTEAVAPDAPPWPAAAT